MGVIARAGFPQTLKADLEVEYREGREARVDDSYKQLLDVMPTTSNSKRINFYGDKGRIRRWRGERQPQAFEEYTYLSTLDDWEYTETVKRQVLDDDQSGGLLRRRVGDFASAVDSSLEIETWEFLRNGSSRKGFDKANFFDFSHAYVNSNGATIGSNTFANMNLGGSQLDTTTVRLLQEHFSTVLKTDKDKNWGGRLTHIVVVEGSDNHKNALEIANSQFTVQANTAKGQMADNIFRGAFNVITTVHGMGASEWFGLDLSDPRMRPLTMLNHSVSPGFDNMEFTQLLEDSETGFWRNEFAFGVYGRFGWNVGDWRTAYMHGSSGYTFAPDDLERQELGDPNA